MIWRGREDEQTGAEPKTDAESHPGVESPPGSESQPGVESTPPARSAGAEDQGTIGGRIESIIEAAEQAAAGIRGDAQERARRYYDESKRKADEMAAQRSKEMTDLTDTLTDRANRVAQQSDQLITALEDAGRRMIGAAPGFGATGPGSQSEVPRPPARVEPPAPPDPGRPLVNDQPRAPAPPPAPPPSPQPPPAEPPPAAPARPAAAPSITGQPSQVSEGARLLATQMAIAGSSRDEIARRLSDEFGVVDPTPILNEIGA